MYAEPKLTVTALWLVIWNICQYSGIINFWITMLFNSASIIQPVRMTETTPKQKRALAEALGKALSRLRKRADITQAQAAFNASIEQGTWARYESGGTNSLLNEKTKALVTAALGLTVDDLMAELQSPGALGLAAYMHQDRAITSLSFPVDGTVRAGPMGFAVYDEGDEEDSFDLSHILDKNTRLLRIIGDSMYPVLRSGELISYNKRAVPRAGHLCVVRMHDGQYFVKTFVQMGTSKVICKEMEAIPIGDRIAYAEREVEYPLEDVRAIYPANIRIE